jgi:hypothetical protein
MALMYGGMRSGSRHATFKRDLSGISVRDMTKAIGTPIIREKKVVAIASIELLLRSTNSLSLTRALL